MFYDIYTQLCEARGVSRSRAAADIGLSNSTVTKWKKTGATPSGETMAKIAAYFGVSVDYLLGNDQNQSTPVGEHDILNDADIAFYNRYTNLNEDEKEDMRDFLNLIEARRKRRERED